MTDSPGTMPEASQANWDLATFDGARREQLRRWSRLSLRQIIEALEEMEQLAQALNPGADPNKGVNKGA